MQNLRGLFSTLSKVDATKIAILIWDIFSIGYGIFFFDLIVHYSSWFLFVYLIFANCKFFRYNLTTPSTEQLIFWNPTQCPRSKSIESTSLGFLGEEDKIFQEFSPATWHLELFRSLEKPWQGIKLPILHGGWRIRYHFYSQSAAPDGPNGRLSSSFSSFTFWLDVTQIKSQTMRHTLMNLVNMPHVQ